MMPSEDSSQHDADYICYRVRQRLAVDGRLDGAAWALAPKSPRFVDMEA